ncbi:N-acetyl-alpha-D-glucosaminyl L-malate synthase BshA [Hydrogenibacillus sp. N12]|uniref:N-acetyl-alpha-D-glucosaminyl L-malate synthase BshA n=1 Tax=Hydrogenibacillus sp. N12 TaxID=2866627 RepID=UPI001C7D69AE|nr:N-acetyl-alpha-D-glucosaminyl L-malate synthase BshA [Hydrogenibacillus sp. N12]QZA32629.1 N-acetyl-alpha-D-glucosaminyl L-malate synthase BshA [Hydrogenibacillus sp. N12]
MRIGIACYASVGGSGVLASELARALARRGHEVHVISDGTPFRLRNLEDRLVVHVVEPPAYDVFRHPPFELALAAKMADVIRHADLDILHVHYAVPFATSAFLARAMVPGHRVKTVTTLHGTDIFLHAYDYALTAAVRLGIEASDAVTAVSHHLADETRAVFGTDRPIEVIHNFVDPDRFPPRSSPPPRAAALRRALAPAGEFLLLHVSNFRPIKRVGDVVRVFAEVRKTHRARLLLVGDGPEHARALALAEAFGVAEDVHALGRIDDVAAVYAAADVLLFPSEKESFGLAAAEAMAAEVPVVASAAGGLPEVVEDGVTGFLLPVGDVPAMAAAVRRLLDDPGLRRRMGAAGRRRVAERFSPAAQVARYEALYKRIIIQQ